MHKKTVLILLFAFILIFMSSCKGQQTVKESETPTPTPTQTQPQEPTQPTEEPKEEPKFGEGFVIPDSSIRPVAVMIDNQGDRVLPQGGIIQAQIIYEMLAEANITRYMAFFWGTMPEMVGPVRSARHYFLDYAMEYDAVYTHVGGSPFAKSDIQKLKINHIDGLVHGKAFWDITNDKKNWQDTYTSKERIENQIAALKYRTEPKQSFPFKYHDTLVIPQDGQTATDITIKFDSHGENYCGFTYNAETSQYERTRLGKPHIERNTNEQVKAANIIVQKISSPLIPGDKEGRRDFKNIGSGNGFYIMGGKAVPIKWSKSARDSQTKYTLENGDPLVLNLGQTWIEIVPDLNYVTIK